jgi:GNAT superfamily N-acetyltransferase
LSRTLPDNIGIRPLTEGDAPFLVEALYHAVFVAPGQPAPPRDIVREPGLALYVADWGSSPHDSGVLAHEEHEAVGAAWTRCRTGEGRGYGFVDEGIPELSIALLPGHRGMGIGSALLAACLEVARVRYPAVSLSVSLDNPARRLYVRSGFITVREEGDSLVMLRTFDSAPEGRPTEVRPA